MINSAKELEKICKGDRSIHNCIGCEALEFCFRGKQFHTMFREILVKRRKQKLAKLLS